MHLLRKRRSRQQRRQWEDNILEWTAYYSKCSIAMERKRECLSPRRSDIDFTQGRGNLIPGRRPSLQGPHRRDWHCPRRFSGL
ncbi:hypothetical protein RRG08_037762 [Elysia crispata]|uniref:Uncharacterized protein n=1 Tax=Elysia crispata TaxID=231223 RepID=A0AAE1A7M5_9GAST|nr:hypothetical protein RRG08_037762 [Elysia crispata]